MEENHLILQHNIGFVQGIHYGDNVFYADAGLDLTPKHAAQELHNKSKVQWEASGTCDWLVRSESFSSWESAREEDGPALLWIHGRFGSGKTVLMSRIIHKIQHERSTGRDPSHAHLLYFYVDFHDVADKNTQYRQVLTTFWEQASPGLKASDTFGKNTPAVDIQQELHKLLVSSGRDVYIFIDAFEQLEQTSQDQLISGLNALAQKLRVKNDGGGCLRVVVSSRDCTGTNQLRGHRLLTIEVSAENNGNDINTYLSKTLESALFRRKPRLRQEVLEKLTAKADGMFLWAHLQAANMCNMTLESQVARALANLTPPQMMSSMYKAYADEFEAEEELIRRQVAQRTVALLAHNNGSLGKDVLLLALSVGEAGRVDAVLHRDLASEPHAVDRFCSYLVRLDEGSEVFRFCHLSVADFFRGYESPLYNRRVAELCLSYLCAPEFSQKADDGAAWYNPGALGSVVQDNPFLQFASLKWAVSTKKSLPPEATTAVKESHSTILAFFACLFGKDEGGAGEGGLRGNLQLAFQIYFISLGKPMSRGISHEHAISYFGLFEFIDEFRTRGWFDVAKADGAGLTPIHWAIRNDNDLGAAHRTVQKLVAHGADVDAKDGSNRNPLHRASHCGNLLVVDLLIDKGAELNSRTENGETALIAACRQHHESIVQRLTEAEVDVTCGSIFGTGLQVISMIGCCSCAKLLLKARPGNRIVEPSGPFGTCLHTAAFYGHAPLIRLLCEYDMDFNATHRTYGSPITAAAEGYNSGTDEEPFLQIIQELVAKGTDVNDKTGSVGPALRSAAYHGGERLVTLLLAKGAKVRRANGQMGSAYQAADERGHEEIKRMLLASDPRAARYGRGDGSQIRKRQVVQRKIFRASVSTSSMGTIDGLVGQFEKFFQREIRQGDSPILRGLAGLGENCFHDVIGLATKTFHKQAEPIKKPPSRRTSLLRYVTSVICLRGRSSPADQPDPAGRPPDAGVSRLRRATTSFFYDASGEHFQQVLDRMTEAAVKILEYAIASEDEQVIKLIANSWTDALNRLVLSPGFGESMLETVIQKRSRELKGFLVDKKLSVEERRGKSRALALVGIELLLAAVERGQRSRHLSYIISKLWTRAVQDVESLGRDGEAPVQEFIEIFMARACKAIDTQDPVNTEVCLKAVLALLGASALSPKRNLLYMFGAKWVEAWNRALSTNMAHVGVRVMDERREEMEQLLREDAYEKALASVLADAGVLRQAIRLGSETAVSSLRKCLEHGLDLLARIGSDSTDPLMERHVRACFDTVTELFATAEQVRPRHLDTVARKVLRVCQVMPESRYGEMMGIMNNLIEEADLGIDPSRREARLVQIRRTIALFIEVALGSEDDNRRVLETLKDNSLPNLTGQVPDIRKVAESAQYTKAARYLDHGQ
ncbi:hypothetical protein N3K66_008440 [Trichothecium roseum]|uniref:Uncharacterized protein n=1 Tax=Trichothecium roseum TaxID=47278 RepID=A0ACC0UQ89_9HYPO|nr:hypothetical protein N3K66_008440 [Trichothecium roseum]